MVKSQMPAAPLEAAEKGGGGREKMEGQIASYGACSLERVPWRQYGDFRPRKVLNPLDVQVCTGRPCTDTNPPPPHAHGDFGFGTYSFRPTYTFRPGTRGHEVQVVANTEYVVWGT